MSWRDRLDIQNRLPAQELRYLPAMNNSLNDLPGNLPVPQDDSAADHLAGSTLPDVSLPATNGDLIHLATLPGRFVIYVYPMTGRPDMPLPDGWDAIPGARGCTPQSCAFRDHYQELLQLDTGVFGLSTQSVDYQREARERLHLPFHLLSDQEHAFGHALNLPSFTVEDIHLYKRLTLIIDSGKIIKVFYPVFPPDRNADEVVAWLRTDPYQQDH